MDLSTFPPIAALLDAAYTALLALSQLLAPVAGSAAAAASIVLVTLLVRVAIIPLGVAQARAEQTRSRIAPRLRELQQRHRRNPERLQREMAKLYADEKTSPFAGCVPMLVQAPVLGLVYALFLHPVIAGHANELLSEQLFGAPLGTSLVAAIGAGTATWSTAVVFGAAIALIVVVAELTRRAFRPASGTIDAAPGGTAMVGIAGALPFTTAVVAVFVPLAAVLYLTTTVVWTLVQRLILRRRYPPATPA